MRALRLVVCYLFIILVSISALALDLKVRVVDPSSAAVSGARVAVYAGDSRQALALAMSDAQGVASFHNLKVSNSEVSNSKAGDVPAPALRVEVRAPGFAPLTVGVPEGGEVTARLKLAPQSETVVVLASPSPVEAGLTGLNVSTLDSAALASMQPIAGSDAIRFLPGVILGDSGNRGGQTSLFVRGGNSDYNKVLLDGVPLDDPGGYFDFGTLSMAGVGRLELMRGSESVLYGSDAMSSVLQITSAIGHTKVPELRFGSDGGNLGTAHGFASLAGARGGYDYNLFGDEFASDGQGENGDYENSTQGANLGMQIAPNEWLRLHVRHNDSRTGVPGETTFLGKQVFPPATDAWARQNNLLGSVEWSLAAPAKWQHLLTVYEYNHQRHDTDLGTDTSESCYDFCAFAAVADINHFGVRYGGEYAETKQARMSFGYEFEDENGFVGDLTVVPPVNHGLRLNHALYGEQFVEWGRLTAIVGARYVHNDSFGNRVVPRASLTYLVLRGNDVFRGTRLKGNYSEGIKEPSLEQSFGLTGYGVFPNPNLKPEQARTLEAGVEQKLGSRIGATATYFNTLYRDQITTNGEFSEYFNLNKSLAHGAELDLSGRISEALQLQGSYFYTSTQILAAPTNTSPIEQPGDPLLLRPKHAGTLLLNYHRPRYGATLGGSFVGRRPDSDFLGLIRIPPATPYTYAAGYARVDAGGWYQVDHHATLYANVENLLNRHYEEVLGYPALTASFRAGVRFRFGGE